MPIQNFPKMSTESPKTVRITVQSPKHEIVISENSEAENEIKDEEMIVPDLQEIDSNIETLNEGSTMMTFANGSMKVPNFVITNIQSLASDSKIQNSTPVVNVQKTMLKVNKGTISKEGLIKISNVNSGNKVPTSLVQQKNPTSLSQNTSEWMNTPIRKYMAKRKTIPTDASSPFKVQSVDDEHAYGSKHQAPIITMKKIKPSQSPKSNKISDRVCRLCMKCKDTLIPLLWGPRSKPEFTNYLKECCSVEVTKEDPMPKAICGDCKVKLLAAWDFRNQCQKSDTEFRKFYKLPPKIYFSQINKVDTKQNDKGIQVECYDRSKKRTNLRPLQQVIIKCNESETSADNCTADDFDTTGNFSEDNIVKDENSASHFLESFAQEISNDADNSEDDRAEVENENLSENEIENENENENENGDGDDDENKDEVKKEVEDKRITRRSRNRKLKEKGNFLCHVCPRVFTTKGFLDRHAKIHVIKKTYTCDTCSKVFKNEDKLITHLRTHDESKNFECPVCGLKYGYEYLLNSHLRLHGRGKPLSTEKNFLCEICSKSFVSQSGLKHHQKLHLDVKPYKCRFCDKTFTMSIYRKKHESRHVKRQFKCHLCPATYASGNGLKNHLLLHTGEAHYHCNTCGKSFRRRKYLNEHMHTHTGEKPFICKMCGIGYGNSGSLFAHQKRCKINFNEELIESISEEVLTAT